MSWRDIDAQLAALGPAQEEESFFRRNIQKPIYSAFGRTQSLLTEPLLGETDAYKAALAENVQRFGTEPDAWESLPGLGDLASQYFTPEFKESIPGRIIDPATRLIGNVVGDPTNWIGAGLIKAGGKLAGGAIQAGRGVTMGAQGEEALRLLDQGLKSKNYLDRIKATRQAVQASGDPKAIKTYDLISKAGLGADISMMAAATAAATPDILLGFSEAAKKAVESYEEGEYGKAGADAASATLMAGLGYLMGKGVINARRAAQVFIESKPAEVAQTLAQRAAGEEAATRSETWRPDPTDELAAWGQFEMREPTPPGPWDASVGAFELQPEVPKVPRPAPETVWPPLGAPAEGQLPLFGGLRLPVSPEAGGPVSPARVIPPGPFVSEPLQGYQLSSYFEDVGPPAPPHIPLDMDMDRSTLGNAPLTALGLTNRQLRGRPTPRKVGEAVEAATPPEVQQPTPPPVAGPAGQVPLFPEEALPRIPRTAPLLEKLPRKRRPVVGEQLQLEFMKTAPALDKTTWVRDQMKLATEDIDRKLDELGSAGMLRTPQENARARSGKTLAGTRVDDRFEYEDFFDAYESGRLEPDGEYVFNKAKYERWKKEKKTQIEREFDDMVRPPEPEVGEVTPPLSAELVPPPPEVVEPPPVMKATPAVETPVKEIPVISEPGTLVPPAEAAPPKAPVPAEPATPVVEPSKPPKLTKQEVDELLAPGSPVRGFIGGVIEKYGIKTNADIDRLAAEDPYFAHPSGRALLHAALGGINKTKREDAAKLAASKLLEEVGGKKKQVGSMEVVPIRKEGGEPVPEAPTKVDPAQTAVSVFNRQVVTDRGLPKPGVLRVMRSGRHLLEDVALINEAIAERMGNPEWRKLATEGPFDAVDPQGNPYSKAALKSLQESLNLRIEELKGILGGEQVREKKGWVSRTDIGARAARSDIPSSELKLFKDEPIEPRDVVEGEGFEIAGAAEVEAALGAAEAAGAPRTTEGFVSHLERVQQKVAELYPEAEPEHSFLAHLGKQDVRLLVPESVYKDSAPSKEKQLMRLYSLYRVYQKLGTDKISLTALAKAMKEEALRLSQGKWELGALNKSVLSTLINKVFNPIINHPNLDLPKVGESVPQKLARQARMAELAKTATAAEAEFGLRNAPGYKVEFRPGGPGRPPATRGREALGVVGRVTGDNGVYLDVSPVDTPVGPTLRFEGRKFIEQGAEAAIPETRHLHILNVGGKSNRSAEDVAKVIEDLLQGNPSLRYVAFSLKLDEVVSPLVNQALRRLQQNGTLKVKKITSAVKGEIPPPSLEGRARAEAVTGEPFAKELREVAKVEQLSLKKAEAKEAQLRPTLTALRERRAGELRTEALVAREAAWEKAQLAAREDIAQQKVPQTRVYEVLGREPLKVEKVVLQRLKEVEHLPTSLLGLRDAALREAHDLDMLDQAKVLDGVKISNIDGYHDEARLTRFAQAHKPIYAKVAETVNGISKSLGMGTTFGGVLSSPRRFGLIVGHDLRTGEVHVSPQGAWWAAGRNPERAAKYLVDDIILHELAHAVENATTHPIDPVTGKLLPPASLEELTKKLSKADKNRDQWIKELSDPELWKGIDGAHKDYMEAVEEIISGKRESWRRAEKRVAGVRAGAAKGSVAALQHRPREGALGAEAGGGPGLRPGGTLPPGVGGEAGGLGRSAAGGRDAGVGAGGPAGRVAGGGEGGQRKLAFYHPPTGIDTVAKARAAIDELANRRGNTPEIQQDAVLLSDALMQQLKANLSDPAVRDEWERRVKAKPDPGRGEAWSRINLALTDASEDAKVMVQIYSEISRNHPELRKLYDVERPVTMADLDPAARTILEVNTPEQLRKKFEGKLKMTYAEQHALRIVATDTINNYNQAEARYHAALGEYQRMPAGPAKDAFFTEKLQPAEKGWSDAASRFNMVDMAINQGTEAGRALAFHRQFRLTSDPEQQMVNSIKESLREFLSGRYKNPRELDTVLNNLMESYETKRNAGNWSTHGALDWYKELQKAYKFGLADKFLQFYKAGLLGWTSRVANIGSNAAFIGILRKMENELGAALEHGWAKLTGQTPERFADEFMLTRMISQRAMKEALPTWVRSERNALAMKPLDLRQSRDFVDDLVKIPSAIGGTLGEFISYMFKGMNSDDALFKHIVKVDHYYRNVYRNLQNGVTGFEMRPGENKWQATERLVGELSQNIADMYDKGQKMDVRFEDIHTSGQKLAQKDTYQEALPGVVKGIQQGLYSGWGRAGQIPLPFVKTPFNIAKQVLIRTPGIGWTIDLANVKNMSHAERVDAVARHATAAMILGGLYSMLGEDTLSGSGPLDPEANMLKRQTGWQPYSIKMGNEWISYQRLEPFSALLGMLADMKEGQRQGDFEKADTAAKRALGSVAENITNKTFLSGLENLSNAFSDPLRYGGEWLERTERSLVPNTIGFVPYGHLAQALDPTYREVGIDPVEVFKSKTPWLSQTLEPQYTPAGEIRKRPEKLGPKIFSPITKSEVRADPVARAAGVLSEINYPMKRIRPTIDYKGITVRLDPEEQRKLALAQNEAMKLIGQRVINDPTFRALPDNEDMADYPGQRTKKDVIARIMRRYRNPVMAQLKPLLRERAAKFLKEEGQQRVASAGGP